MNIIDGITVLSFSIGEVLKKYGKCARTLSVTSCVFVVNAASVVNFI